MAASLPVTAETALARAALWLGVLIEAAECDPETTTVRLGLSGGERDGETVAAINLADDLAAFAALGARSDCFAEGDA